ncbi:MAG: hypothetical protein ACD_10C00198G0001, partial [uncultured bacterium]
MMQSDFAGKSEQIIVAIEDAAGLFQHLVTFRGMSFDNLALCRIEFAWLLEDVFGNGNLAHVMKNAGGADVTLEFRRNFFPVMLQLAENLHDFIGHDRHAQNMIAGIPVLVLREAGQRDDHGAP